MSYEAASFKEHKTVRLPTLHKLLDLGWNRGQIICPSPDTYDKEWRVPKNPSAQAARERGRSFKGFPVDIAVFDSVEGVANPEHALFIVECKLPGDVSGLTELETYLTLEPHAKMGVLTNGIEVTRTYKLHDGSFKRQYHAKLPSPEEDLIVLDASVTGEDLHVPSEQELRQVFDRLLNVVVSIDGSSTRSDDRLDQICNLLLLKFDSDAKATRDSKAKVFFQVQQNRKATAERINTAFERYCRQNPSLFDTGERFKLRLDDATIHAAVYELQNLNLSELRPTSLSYAFQVFRSANLKVGEGQYYTPHRVIEAGTLMMQIDAEDRVIDPACGTGGFISQAFLTVRDVVGEAQASRWANHNLYGVDLDNINVKLVRALMVGMGDGSTNALLGDSLRERKWIHDRHGLSDALSDGAYTVVITNPPFGKDLRLSAADAREAGYTVCDRSILGDKNKTYADTELGIVFVERAWRLLEEGGRLGIVLPETYFFSKKYEWFRRWVDQHFDLRGVLNIPMEAFQGFCRAKTNFYAFEKRRNTKEPPSFLWSVHGSVWISNAPTIGINKDGKELYVLDAKTHGQKRQLDNCALDDVRSLVLGEGGTATSWFVPTARIQTSFIGVPKYSDQRTMREHDRWVRSCLPECSPITLGSLVEMGHLVVRGGHGSPSAEIRGGDIPYIKVSDLRSGMINPNSSNMVSYAVAKKYWRRSESGLKPYDILTPARASKNIGEPVMLIPGQERIVLTKEVLVFSVTSEAPFDSFYLMWALSNAHVQPQWERIVFMQTNREDVGNRWNEIRIPFPLNDAVAQKLAKPFRDYYLGISDLRMKLQEDLERQKQILSTERGGA